MLRGIVYADLDTILKSNRYRFIPVPQRVSSLIVSIISDNYESE